MGPADSPSKPPGRLWIPGPRGAHPLRRFDAPPDCPPRGGSQVPDTTFDARRPTLPRTAQWLHVPVASPPVPGFAIPERLATARRITRLHRFTCITADVFAGPETPSVGSPLPMPGRLRGKQAIHTASSFQLTSCAKLRLAYQDNRIDRILLRRVPLHDPILSIPLILSNEM